MPQLGEIYAQQGFFSPVSAISETEAKELRQDYEAAERENCTVTQIGLRF